jgi:hypothetical protein
MPTTTTLQQTANKLGISVNALREYMAAKSAEVAPRTMPPMRQLASGK